MGTSLLSPPAFAAVLRDAPLVSIDLLIEDENGRYLFGLRRNPPAQDFWFVPGGRILKNESLDAAFLRLCRVEIGLTGFSRSAADFLGVYEHFYDENALNEPGFGTHYVVLAHRLLVRRVDLILPDAQHFDYSWLTIDEALQDASVHEYSRAYLLWINRQDRHNRMTNA